MLRELAGFTGLVKALDGALADTYRGPWLGAGTRPDLGEEMRIDRRVAAFVVVRPSMLEVQHRASTLS
jgi:hypothetical protein